MTIPTNGSWVVVMVVSMAVLGTITAVSAVDNRPTCYNAIDRANSYAGTSNVTDDNKPCLLWEDVAGCHHHPYHELDVMNNLEKNYCRNPDARESRPWCYVNAETCARQSCSQVCEKAPTTDCVVTKNDGTVARYKTGERRTVPCHLGHETRSEEMCMSNGEWRVIKSDCLECPIGYGETNGKCYLVIHKLGKELDLNQMKNKCTQREGTLITRVLSENEYKNISSLVVYVTPQRSERDTGHASARVPPPNAKEKNIIDWTKDFYKGFVCETDVKEYGVTSDIIKLCPTLMTYRGYCEDYPALRNLCKQTCKDVAEIRF